MDEGRVGPATDEGEVEEFVLCAVLVLPVF